MALRGGDIVSTFSVVLSQSLIFAIVSIKLCPSQRMNCPLITLAHLGEIH